jgi:deazaflavin-dependent oxidoreductase (nitroreductase family)
MAREPSDPPADPGRPARQAGNDEACLHLRTRGWRTGLPRESELWFTCRDGRHYVIAETGEQAHWVRNLRADPRVSWRVGARTLRGRARVVDAGREPALAGAVQALSVAKYGWGDGLVVELVPDPAPHG